MNTSELLLHMETVLLHEPALLHLSRHQEGNKKYNSKHCLFFNNLTHLLICEKMCQVIWGLLTCGGMWMKNVYLYNQVFETMVLCFHICMSTLEQSVPSHDMVR